MKKLWCFVSGEVSQNNLALLTKFIMYTRQERF